MNAFRQLFIVTTSVLALSSCFTGVESTPKITTSDVKREKVHITPEQQWLTESGIEPFAKWEIGKELYVTDNKITLALNPIYTAIAPLEKATIRYTGYREVLSVIGDTATELLFNSPDGIELAYRINLTPQSLRERSNVDIPFTIEWSVIEAISQQMLGQKFWILTSRWYNTDDQATTGQKYVPVTITGIKPGNTVYPITLEFIQEQHANTTYHLFMSVGESTRTLRSFASLFALTDPRKNYPDISDENWQSITNERVRLEMTRDECRLALGAPKEINRQTGYSSLHEIWTYESGVYLIFEDGLLVRFRR